MNSTDIAIRARRILDELNAYEARGLHPDDLEHPHNIWQDVILCLPEYDETLTGTIDRGQNDVFVALETIYRYDPQAREWHFQQYVAPASSDV